MSDLVLEIEGIIPAKVLVNVRDQLRISKDLDAELDVAAEQYGFYGSLAEKAETKKQRLDLGYKLWRADEERRVLEQHKMEELKSPTKDQMISHIRGTKKYKDWKLMLIDIDEKVRILKILSKAFEKKVETIRTKCSNKRKGSSSHD